MSDEIAPNKNFGLALAEYFDSLPPDSEFTTDDFFDHIDIHPDERSNFLWACCLNGARKIWAARGETRKAAAAQAIAQPIRQACMGALNEALDLVGSKIKELEKDRQ